MLAVLGGFPCCCNYTLLFFSEQLLANKKKEPTTTNEMIKWLGPASCLWCLLGVMFFISRRRKAALASGILLWSNPPPEGSQEKESCYLPLKILFLSPQLRRNTRIDIDSHKELTRTLCDVCDVRLEGQQEQNLHVNPPELFCDWQPIRKAAMFHGGVRSPLLCRPPSHCSVGERAAQTEGWDSFNNAAD